ncbi:histidine kinase [Flavobacteriaceae bacterium UJ101]|nr:histidine kinase [Flavobacteriaceae bacterium UJ101]
MYSNDKGCPKTLLEYDKLMKPVREDVHKYWDRLYLNKNKVIKRAPKCLQNDLGLNMYVDGCSILFGPDIDLYTFEELKKELDQKYSVLKTNPKTPWDEIIYDYTLFVLAYYLSECQNGCIVKMIDFQEKIEGANAFFVPEIWSLLAASYTGRMQNDKSLEVLNQLEKIADDELNLHMLHLNRMFSYDEALQEKSELYDENILKKEMFNSYEKLYALEDFNQNYGISKIGLMQADQLMAIKYLEWNMLDEADIVIERLKKHIDKKNEGFYIRYFYFKVKAVSEGKKKHFIESEKFFKKALQLCVNIKDSSMVYDYYAKMLYDKGDYKNAYNIDIIREQFEDQIYENDKVNAIQMAIEKYETTEKEKKIKLLGEMNQTKDESIKQKNITLVFGGITFLLTGFLVYFLIKQNKLTSEIKTVRLEQRLLRTQMNPHFMFNTLATIDGLMLDNRIEEASDGIAQFAELMRTILENSREDFVSLNNELKVIHSYVELQQLRFNDRFTFEVQLLNVESNMLDQFLIPPMLIQPFIENAINHGFKKEDKNYRLVLKVLKKENQLKVFIEDNGEGFLEDKNKLNNRRSYSIQITKERLELLTKSTKRKSDLIINENVDENISVQVILEIPLKNTIT